MDLSELRLGKEFSALGMESELQRLAAAARTLDTALEAISATAVSPDRLIKVTVTGGGEVRDLQLDPGIYRDQDASALAASILATIARANAATAAKVAVAYDDFEEEVS